MGIAPRSAALRDGAARMTDQPYGLDAVAAAPDIAAEPGPRSWRQRLAAVVSRAATLLGIGTAGLSQQSGQQLERSVYAFILHYSRGSQVWLIAITAFSFPFYYYSLDLPKIIVNRALRPGDEPGRFPVHLFGFDFDQIGYLLLLCTTFLVLVLVNGGLKYYMNVLKNRVGERMLRRLRYELYSRILRFPLNHFKRTSPGEIIPMVTAEVEQIGGFIGDSFSLPLYQGGTLLVALYYLYSQDWVLGLAASLLYPLQIYVIPKLQGQANRLGKQRVRVIRALSDRIGESIVGIEEIHANDGARRQLTDIAGRLGRVYEIRYEIFAKKFLAKFLNNFIQQLTPFFFYSIGGYLVIRGQLSFGALVAVLGAYKDMASPFNELLTFYQTAESARIIYEQVVEQFDPPGMIDSRLLLDEPDQIAPLSGEVDLAGVSLVDEDRGRILDNITTQFPLIQHTGIVGQGGSGKYELGQILARLVEPSSGHISIGGQDLVQLPHAVTGRRIAYVSGTAALFSGSLRDNLLFGLSQRPVQPFAYEDADLRRFGRSQAEARRAGNIDFDLSADWVDYVQAGCTGPEDMLERIVEVLKMVQLDQIVYDLGLNGRLAVRGDDAAEHLLDVRRAFEQQLKERELSHLVEPFDPSRYNLNGTVAENILFGTPVDPTFDADNLPSNPYLLRILDEAQLTDTMVETGKQVAETMVELFGGLSADNELMEQFSFITAEELPEFQHILMRWGRAGIRRLRAPDRSRLLGLALKLSPARHRLGLIDDALQQKLLDVRRRFREGMEAEIAKGRGKSRRPDPTATSDMLGIKVEFFDADRYSHATSIQNNILFGFIAQGEAGAEERVHGLVGELVDAAGLRSVVVEVGLDFSVGSGGVKFTTNSRQRVAIARAVLKRPDLLVLNEATAALDPGLQSAIMAGIKEEFKGRGLVWILHRAGLAREFDHILVMSNGQLVEEGQFDTLSQGEHTLKILMHAEE